MIIKNFELNKINLEKNRNILLYGKNEGLKKEVISNLIKKLNYKILNFDEKEILGNTTIFIESLLSESLFDKEKIIIVKRATDKIYSVLKEVFFKNLKDIFIIINAETLEKKSKLRMNFEKSKENICIAFYPDTTQTLLKLAYNY